MGFSLYIHSTGALKFRRRINTVDWLSALGRDKHWEGGFVCVKETCDTDNNKQQDRANL
jgi:hypothetical protein